jgi:hypothetical protein
MKKAGSVVGTKQETFDSINKGRLVVKVNTILDDVTHSLRAVFDSQSIESSGRYRVPVTRTTRFNQSFVPRAIHALSERGHKIVYTESASLALFFLTESECM